MLESSKSMPIESSSLSESSSSGLKSEPEPLGSLTFTQDGETGGCLQLRTSARVSKKLRLDLNSSYEEKKEIKEEEKIDNKNQNAVKEVKTPVIKEKDTTKDGKPHKKRVDMCLWSQEDKTLFFEAITEHGKDFDALQNYFLVKGKKKGIDEKLIKSREQIRHFYYRTWHKISKHLKFPEGINRGTQELYGLINYGELRKRAGLISEKTSLKLNELIYKGSTQIRQRGKTLRIRTPLCKALRSLNELEECQELLRLPSRVTIELTPRRNEDWTRVQSLAQNPRIQTVFPLQRRLNSLISYLQDRWRPEQNKLRDRFIDTLISNNVPTKTEDKKDELLRLAPRRNANINLPTVNLTEYLTSWNISLKSYQERINRQAEIQKTKQKKKRQREEAKKLAQEIKKELFPINSSISNSTDIDKAIKNVISLQNLGCEKRLEKEIKNEGDALVPVHTNKSVIEKVREGWTLKNATSVTIGELYLMFGQDSKVQLDYWWDSSSTAPPPVILPPKEEDKYKEKEPKEAISLNNAPQSASNPIAETLKQLLSIARLNYRKTKVQCPCGHVCSPTKNSKKSTAKAPEVSTVTSANKNSPPQPTTPNDDIFRRPIAPLQFKSKFNNVEAFKKQLEKFRPRYCNRRGRTNRSKQVVIPKIHPILPKGRNVLKVFQGDGQLESSTPATSTTVINLSSKESSSFCHIAPIPWNRDNQEHQVQTTHLHNQPTSCTSFMPKLEAKNLFVAASPVLPTTSIIIHPPETLLNITSTAPDLRDPLSLDNCTAVPSTSSLTDDLTTPVPSPPNISNLLGMSTSDNDDNFLTSNMKTDFSSMDETANVTPPTSPSRILKETENDNHWLNAEVADFSLSSFLGHLESPLKCVSSIAPSCSEDTRLSSDVEAQFQCLMSENSVDYMAKFADLAAEIASSSETTPKK